MKKYTGSFGSIAGSVRPWIILFLFICCVSVTKVIAVHALPGIDPIAGPSDVCVGSNITLTNATPGGTWSSSDNLIATIDVNGNVTGVAEGMATITYTVTNDFNGPDFVTMDVNVHALPLVDPIAGLSDVCVGSVITLTDATPDGTWSSSDDLIATIDVNGMVTGVAEGMATITYTVTNGFNCTAFVTKDVNVHALPFVEPITGGDFVCAGSYIYLSDVTPGGIWSSSDELIATVDGSGIVTGVADGTVTITYTVTNEFNCSVSVTKDIAVHALPVVDPIAGPSDVCAGSDITLTDATPGGTWSSSDEGVATVLDGVVTGVSQGTVTITYTVNYGYKSPVGCITEVTHDVNVHALPVVEAIAGLSDVCVGSVITLTDATPDGTWSSSDNMIATVDGSGMVTGVAEGMATITYSVTNGFNCTAFVTMDVNVHALPVVESIAGLSDVCVGSVITLADATPDGTWSSSDDLIATIDVNGMVTGVADGMATITYSVTNGFNCTAFVTMDVNVHALPFVEPITGGDFVCAGSYIYLSDVTPGGIWSSSDELIATVDGSGMVTGVADGTVTITYTVTNEFNCSVSVTKDIAVHALPVVDPIAGPSDVCVGSYITLTDATPGGTWISSDEGVATVLDGVVTGVSEGTVTITYTVNYGYKSPVGCITEVTHDVNVHALPVVEAIAGLSDVCVGSVITLTDATPDGTWSSSDELIASVDESGMVTGVAEGMATITYTVTNGFNCTAFVTMDVNVHALPVVESIAGPSDVCVGSVITLTDATPDGTWSSSDDLIATIDVNGMVTGVAEGMATITYTVTNGFNCTAFVTKDVNVHSLPVVESITGFDFVCAGSNIYLSDVTPGGIWSSSDELIATVDGSGMVTGVADGTVTITYTVTNEFNCSVSVTKDIAVHALPVVDPIAGPSEVCAGSDITLTDATPGGTWISSDEGVATVLDGVVTGVSEGTVTITYTVNYGYKTPVGCSTAVIQDVNVHALPVVEAIAGLSDVCVGSVITLTDATPDGTWSSSDELIASIDGSGMVTGVAEGMATITYNVTNGFNCTAFVTTDVNVHALPVVESIAGPSDVCVGSVITLADATPDGTWSSSDELIASVDGSGMVTGVADGMATITYTVTNGFNCTAFVTKDVNVHALPVVESITGFDFVCAGSYIYLSDVTPGGTWSSSDNMIAIVDGSGMVTGVADGTVTITYTVTNAFNCSVSVIKDIAVHALPVVDPIAGPSDVCVGSDVTLTDATPGGTWSSSDEGVATVLDGVVTGVSEGTVTITYTVNYGYKTPVGCSTTVIQDVNVHALPVVEAIAGLSDVCVGSVITLTDATPDGTWSSSDELIASVDGSGMVTGVAEGMATITYTVTNGFNCTAFVTTDVNVHALPVVESIAGPSDVCVGLVITLTDATPDGTWSSSDELIASVDGSGMVTGVADGMATITYTVTNGFNCTAFVTKDVNVHALPVVESITGFDFVCAGSYIYLSDVTPGGTWSSSDNMIAIVDGSGMVTGVADGTVTITYTVTNAFNCSVSVIKDIAVHALPVVDPIAGPSDVCVGSDVTLTDATPGGTWSSSDEGVATVLDGVVTGVSEGTVTITYTVTEGYKVPVGCLTAVTHDVNVHPLPVVEAIAGLSDVCVGSVITLTDATPDGTWSSSDELIASVDGSGMVTGLAEGMATITYTVTNGFNCTAFVTKDVNVHAMPVVDPIAGLSDVCIGSVITLTDATLGGTWSSSDETKAIVNGGVVTGVSAGALTISYMVTNGNSCFATVNHSVTVNPLPSPLITPGGPTSFCPGGSVVLTASGGSGYLWSTGAATDAITAITTGVYMVTVTNGFSCSAKVSQGVTVNPLPVAIITPGSATTFCQGGSVNLTASGGTGYVWSTGATTDAISANATGIYTVTVTNEYSCTATASQAVTVNPFPAAAGVISGPAVVTLYQTGAVFSITPVANATGYIWSLPAGATITAGNNTWSITVSFSGSAVSGNITVTGTNACGNGTVSPALNLTVNPAPRMTVNGTISSTICIDASNTITLAGPGHPFIVAAPDGNVTLIAGMNILLKQGTIVEPGAYLLGKIYSGSWCGAKAAAVVTVPVAQPEAVPVAESSTFVIYPNPTNSNFTLVQKGDRVGNVKVEIFNMRGEKVMIENIPTAFATGEKKHDFNFTEMATGLYFVKIIAGDNIETIKLVKIR